MTHSNLRVEVQGTHILVVLRGTCFKAKYRKQEAPLGPYQTRPLRLGS
jgi:hypothetical protein